MSTATTQAASPAPVTLHNAPPPPGSSRAALWTGRVLSALPILALTASAVFKFRPPNADMIKGMEHVGWPMRVMFGLGIVELSCALLYAIPQTAVLGAILCTGYLGGAIATHVRVGDPFFVQSILGVLVWAGLYLRDPRVRDLIPLRRLG
jgi:hypothetical protein